MTSVKYDHLQVMETKNWKNTSKSLEKCRRFGEKRTSVDKMATTDKGP